MKKVVSVYILVILLFIIVWSYTKIHLCAKEPKNDSESLPAFPGAEGFGAYTPGGRGGKVLLVTNLNDNGPGSLREAIETSGPRVVIFRVSGTIELKYELKIRHPYITIAGQTAPGDGICIKNEQLTIETNDVVVRYMRIRPGDLTQEELDAISIRSDNVIIDHCSASWSIDEVLSPTGNSNNVTIQWCIISEALHDSYHQKGPHGFGTLLHPAVDSKVTYHHNLIAHHWRRFPGVGTYNEKEILLDYRNNVCYNWGDKALYSWGRGESVKLNLVGNYFRAGYNTLHAVADIAYVGVNTDHWVWQEGNLMNGRNIGWHMIKGTYRKIDSELEIDEIYRVKTDDVYESYDRVLNHAGAVLPKRDKVDERVVQSVRDGTGKIIDSQNDVGGWPELHNGTPPDDTDLDGMPDSWEIEHNLDPEDSSDAAGTDLSECGYTNIEVYINSLAYIK